MNVATARPFTLLPPPPGCCPECAVEHGPDEPHNAQSLFYQVRFRQLHGRMATWADATAHCAADVRRRWLDALRAHGVPAKLLGECPEAAAAVTPERKDGAA